ncbi:acetyl-CoA-benzylalcohol acetyltransferase-like [Rhodamnia argentea]|uniref:Acetyl-CoA-benzylalcohol acetyltransferase-like n=1 Tax=Rhodamnia argentea TaxID=178133 RepID=A0ABM3HF92_9MYRT|nr:acetyl-CoA-benzylalcohol acetyltransferase-like [Rhodamnia argentea]
MKVELQSRKLVKPLDPTPDHCRKLGLSFIDDLSFSNYVGVVFCYRSHERRHEINTLQKLHRLEESLSETLTLFYPLAGQYVEDGLFINCNDQGVELIQAKVDGTLDQLLQGDVYRDLLSCLSTFPPQAANSPLVIVQANSFDCGGLAIGLSVSHKIGDMYTMAIFMNSWATACRSGIHDVIPPNFELPSLFPANEPAFSPMPAFPLRKKFALARLEFSGLALLRLKAASNASNSRVEIASALICKALISIDRATKGLPRPSVFVTSINLHERLQLKIPANACGNFFAHIITPFAVEKSGPTFDAILHLIGDVHRNAKSKYAAIADASELRLMVADSWRDYVSIWGREEANLILISSWCRFPLYDSDFGWGTPDLVSKTSPPMRSVFLMDSPVDGGIDAWITLNQDEMVLFKQDPDIVACTSKLLLPRSAPNGKTTE